MRRGVSGMTVLAGLALAVAGGALVVSLLRAVKGGPADGVSVAADARAFAGEGDGVVPVEGKSGVPERAVDGRSALLDELRAPPPGEAAPGGDRVGVGGVDLAVRDDPILQAVRIDPFSPERRPPARRYQLPGERRPVVREEPRERPEAPDFRVVGTAAAGLGLALVRADGPEPRRMALGEPEGEFTRVVGEAPAGGAALALVQVDDGDPRLVSLGESVRGYTLAAVDAESATLVGPAGTLRFPVSEPAVRRDDDDRRRRGRNEQMEQRVREAQERLQEMRSRIQEMQNVRLRFSPGRVVLPGGGAGRVELEERPVPAPVVIPSLPGGGGGGGPASPAP